MKKLKFVLLMALSIICLNSCFFLASFCADHGCMGTGMPKVTKKDPDGIGIILNTKGYENYFEEILTRPKEYVEIENQKILLPKNMILKEFKHTYKYEYGYGRNYIFGEYQDKVKYYLYDKERKIGFPLGFWIDKENRTKDEITSVIAGTSKYLKKTEKNIRPVR